MFVRYAVFYTPPPGPFAEFCAAWLGWDSRSGTRVPHPRIDGLDIQRLTETPRKYGFHGTLKAPFRLTGTAYEAALFDAVGSFARRTAPVTMDALQLQLHRDFVALRPAGSTPNLNTFAKQVVTDLDGFRAPAPPEDLVRRRASGLTPRQDYNLTTWGYPYVMEDFHFHLTLTGRLEPEIGQRVMDQLETHINSVQPDPFVLDHITLMGQDSDGMFHEIHRYALTG